MSLSTALDGHDVSPDESSRHSARGPEDAPRHSARSPEGAETQNLGDAIPEVSTGSTAGIGRPRGVRLGIDVGKARIGVAGSDPDGLLAMPIATVKRQAGSDVTQIAKVARERGVIVAYLGLPKHMSGKEGESAADARKFAHALAAKLPEVEFRFIDERLTTVTAAANLSAAGRKASRQKSVIDQQAAVIILQTALDAERASGQLAGSEITGTER